MKILVTGAAGFIGSFVAKSLAKKHDVVGVDNLNDYYDTQLKQDRLKLIDSPNFKFTKLDLVDKKSVVDLFASNMFDQVIHLAAQAGVRYSIENPYAYVDSNITGFLNILESCKEQAISKIIYASSSSVYGNSDDIPFSEKQSTKEPVSIYAVTKKTNELMAHTYAHLNNMDIVGLRFFTVYGPYGRPDMAPFLFADSIFKQKEINVFNNGNLKRDFTYIDDIVEAITRVAHKDFSGIKHEVFNIGHGSPVNLMDFIKCMEKSIGIKAQKKFLQMQPGDVYQTYADTSKLEHFINFKPSVSLDTGVDRFISWFKEYKNI